MCGGNRMAILIDALKRNPESSEAKSYFIGMERGREWAEDCADYFDIRRWGDYPPEEAEHAELPEEEDGYFHALRRDTPLEWHPYLKGWLAGVRQIRERY